MLMFIDFFFMQKSFFFQAEDGIRDIGVTGVQTCALPILMTCRFLRSPSSESPAPLPAHCSGSWPVRAEMTAAAVVVLPRSEERRVGKECRSRWSPYH